ncbi:hypothetical protein CFter6_3530 [Collimonas fungivorans]|uniref:Uncharacterized protein n=1 Tax=Collimonas fungivorans TaxID=158899 RepID=A0A127PEM4_9BURK|nr:hypothetical protein CFter6_3530 [Collimonas fungivorans]
MMRIDDLTAYAIDFVGNCRMPARITGDLLEKMSCLCNKLPIQ